MRLSRLISLVEPVIGISLESMITSWSIPRQDYIFNPQKEKSYNRGLKPYRFKNVKEYQDEIGWYT